MNEVTVLTGVDRRRRWSDDEKLDLIEATMEPGANVSEIAREADIAPAQLYRWRKELLDPAPVPEPEEGFAPVVIDDTRAMPACGTIAAVIEIDIGGSHLRITADAPPSLVSVTLEGLRG
tara:strand:+ start:977 stop:1336 length:360 start_codon:yes stop_codon:yes gene_type:complete